MSPNAQAVQQEMQSVADQLVEQVPATLRALKRHYNQTNDSIAEAMGEERHFVQERLAGSTGLSLPDLVGFAKVFGVTTEVLFLEPEEAILWVIQNQARPMLRSRCDSPDGLALIGI